MLSTDRKVKFRMIGLMSGSSLDGLDICYCEFTKNGTVWAYTMGHAETIKYPQKLQRQLRMAMNYNAEELTQLDFSYGKYIGQLTSNFIGKHRLKVDYIAWHGHTILHNPSKGYTLQIGKGAAIAAETGIPCITDFRSGDICRGGQGAPLVPIGDKLLFHDFDICLNLGGIANISYDSPESHRLAYDVCVCNMILNHLAGLAGKEYDHDGTMGKAGQVIPQMLHELENLEYYKNPSPKSLGREWFQSIIVPVLNGYAEFPLSNQMRTAYEHITSRIADDCNRPGKKTLLATGGGAKNKFLMELIGQKTKLEITLPDRKTIDFKEALIFAFLGVLYLQKEPGALSSVTGASSNSIAGCLYY